METKIDYEKKGLISEIERYAIHDGPGIRTIVFTMGCPLRCRWCANPEAQNARSRLMYWQTRCIGCRRCIDVCPKRALSWNGSRIVIDRSICAGCGTCANHCNSEALTAAGQSMSVAEVMDAVMKDMLFYQNSGGGVTFSGGEAMLQTDFILETAKACREHGINTCIETCGCVPWEDFERIMPYIDLFLYDIKITNDAKHREYTGVSNKSILDNFAALVRAGADVNARIPIIPGINDSAGDIDGFIEFFKQNGKNCRVSLLPYHRLGVSKYEKLGSPYALPETEPPSEGCMSAIAQKFSENGFDVSIGE